MVRKTSTHSRRKSSAVTTPLAHVVESENEQEEQVTLITKAAQELKEMETLEAEREARFQQAERELQSVLETENVSDHVRKRQLTRLFDRFRVEYAQLSLRFRDNLRGQQKLMDKCLEMKNELVMSAIRIKTAKQLQDEEMKNLVYYREECEHAWKATSVCEERERDAMRIIDQLKSEIDELQGQVKTLLGIGANNRYGTKSKPTSDAGGSISSPSFSSMCSPLKTFLPAGSPLSSPSKANAGQPTDLPDPPQLMSFDEWKVATRVWNPHVGSPKVPTPTQEELFYQERRNDMARCVSAPTLQPTAMERAGTAITHVSPSRRQQQRVTELEPRRATTSVSTKRISSTPQQLPSVATRKSLPS